MAETDNHYRPFNIMCERFWKIVFIRFWWFKPSFTSSLGGGIGVKTSGRDGGTGT